VGMNEIARGTTSVVGADKHVLRNVARVGGSEQTGENVCIKSK